MRCSVVLPPSPTDTELPQPRGHWGAHQEGRNSELDSVEDLVQ